MNHPAAHMPEAPAKTRPRERLYAVARVVLPLAGLGLLAYLVYANGWKDVVAAFRRLGPTNAAALGLLGLTEILLDGEALRRAMLGRIKLGWTLASNSAGALVNLAIPFEAGEVVKGALLRQHSTDSRVISGLVIWNFVWKSTKPLLVLTAFWVAQALGNAYSPELFWPLLGGVAVSFAPYLILRTLFRLRPAERGMRFLGKLPLLRRSAPRFVQAAARIDAEVRDFWVHHPIVYGYVFALQFGARFTGLVSIGLFARAFGLPADLGSIALLYVASVLADWVAMLAPSRIGVSEGAYVILFRTLGLDPTMGLVIGLTLRLRAVVVQAPFALAGWVSRRRSRPPTG